LIDTLGELNYSETADAALHVFEERATHAFPPTFIMLAAWHPELETLAVELDFPIKTSAEIERRLRGCSVAFRKRRSATVNLDG
jgi:hypothetical protein